MKNIWVGLVVAVVVVVGVTGCGGLTSVENGGGTDSGTLRILPNQTLSAAINPEGQANVSPQTLLAEGGSPLSGYTWTIASGSTFPPGTTVWALTGVFWGSGAGLSVGSYPIRMQVSDGSSTATGTVTLVVQQYEILPWAVLQQWPLSQFALMDARAGHPYGASLFAMGGEPPYTWAEDTTYSGRTDFDVSGLTIDATRGVVRGTPMSSAAGKTLRFRVIVRDGAGDTAVYAPVYTITVQ